MKRIFTLFAIIISFHLLSAQETYRFRTDMPQGPNIESSTASGLSLHYVLNEITVADYNHGDDKGQEILMKGSFGSFAEGLPNLPFENHYIAVPRGAKVKVKVKENGCLTLNGIDLLPAAEVILNNAAEQPKLRKDMSVFGKDANFPTKNVTIAQSTQIRGLDVVMLNITPFRYNPVRKTLEVIYDMDIEISFEGGNGQFGDARYRNPAWDGIFRDLVINSNMLPEAHYYERLNEAIQNREEGCEYLIITLDDSAFMAWADTLKQFRTKQGILTKVVTTADCGSNEPEDIRNYILNAYENWTIPPAAVLLFGGNHIVPNNEFGLKPFLFTSPPSIGTYTYPTDNPFADMNGDSIPDIAISRMLVYDATECQQQMEKLIEYELNPPTDPHYYDHPVITSGYQEDKWFTITSQIVNNFLCNILGKHATNNYMVYIEQSNSDPNPPDSIWSTALNTSAVMNYFGPNGTNYIPWSIGYLDHWDDLFDSQPLIDAMTEGGFLTFYRDHSGESIWCCPWFACEQLPLIQNEKPTFIFSIGCLTNDFWDNWSVPMCLSEAFLKEKNGAIGVIGANTVTYSHYNDLISWGMLDYLWPEFMPTLGSQNEPDFSYPSYSLVAGKLFLRRQTFLPYTTDTMKVEKTLNLFSYLGETYLSLFTKVPQQMEIEAGIYSNSQSQYTITAEKGATICLSSDGEILVVAKATGHPQTLTFPILPIGERLHITVTKQNCFRFEQTARIVSSSLPFVYLKSTDLYDQDDNGQFDYGEYVTIDLTLHNYSLVDAESGEVELQCESPFVEILQSTIQYPPMKNYSTYILKNAFKIRLTNNVPDQKDILLYAYITQGENTHKDPIPITASAPLIYIHPEFYPMTAEGQPSTHINTEGKSFITFNIKNIGHSPLGIFNSTLDIKAPFIEAKPYQHKGLEPNEESSITLELNTMPNDITGAWLQSRLDIQYGEYHTNFDTIIQYGGIFEDFETDTFNSFFKWTNIGTHKWEYSNDAPFEGQRCLVATADTTYHSILKVRLKNPYVAHNSKISFYYQTGENEHLDFFTQYQNQTVSFSNTEWKYGEVLYNGRDYLFNWKYLLSDINSSQAKLDNLCFPPMHTTIAYAGDDIITCNDTSIELVNSYAYDCDTINWDTDGDGMFEDNTIANAIYIPGIQDLTNGNVALTLTAFGNDTIVSKTHIYFVDEVNLGEIIGDSVVNKYSNPVSHYAIERQDGICYLWQLEPAIAGTIYDHNDAIDILWNLYEGDAEVTLSVMADHSCTMEPVTKSISLIGYSTAEWHSTDFDLFPNPTDGKVNLVIGETLQGKAVVEVYNLLGERMMAKSIGRLQKGETINLDLSHLVSGLYIIKLSTESGSCTKKVSVW